MRPLGANELWYLLAEQHTPTNIGIAMEIFLPLDQAKITTSLKNLFSKHWVLSWCVDLSDRLRPAWKKSGTRFIYEEFVFSGGPEKFLEILEAQSERPIDFQSHLLRVVHLTCGEKSTVLLILPHFAADGRSLGMLAKDFAESLNRPAVLDATPPPLPPVPLETLLKKSLKWGLARAVYTQLRILFKNISLKPKRLTIPASLSLRRKTMMSAQTFDSQLSRLFFDKVKAEKIQVHSVLCALLTKSLIEIEKWPDDSVVPIGSPCDIRSQLKDSTLFGPYVSSTLTFAPGKMTVTDLAKLIGEDIRRSQGSLETLAFVKSAAFITGKGLDQNSKALGKLLQTGPGHFTVTSLGLFRPSEMWKCLGFFGSLNISGFLAMMSLTTADGELSLIWGYVEQVKDRAWIHQLKDIFEKQLLAWVKTTADSCQ